MKYSSTFEEHLGKIRLLEKRQAGSVLMLAIAAPMEEQMLLDIQDAFLSERERLYVSYFTIPKRKRDWLAGRLIAKQAVAAFFHTRPTSFGDLQLFDILPEHVSERHGPPRLWLNDDLRSDLFLSISHWPFGIAAAVSTEPLGIDGEQVLQIATIKQLAFTLDEQVFMQKLELQWHWSLDRLATLFWTIKEAYLKLSGTGLNIDLKNLEVLAISQEKVLLANHARGCMISLPTYFLGTTDWLATIVTSIEGT